jgi:acyl-CoA synthetase (AMP-forming)/AMP-acid ligase II
MGLMTGVVSPMLAGRPSVLMPPAAFLVRPLLWLQALARHHGTIAAAPNFAYDLCVDRIKPDQIETLDLSAWRVAVCGAEPVRRETLERFAAHFGAAGFDPRACMPAYGLAEATLFVSGGPPASGLAWVEADAAHFARHSRIAAPLPGQPVQTLVSSGIVHDEVEVRIVDPDRLCAAAPDTVGEIWLRGESVACGYVSATQTAASFAVLADCGDGPFLRTGDLGVLIDGALYVTGRRKDLLIVNGANHYPQDIEASARESHPACTHLGGAAFLDEGASRLIIVQELARGRDTEAATAAAAIVDAVFNTHGLAVAEVLIVAANAVPRTTSGKIQRSAARAAAASGTLPVLFRWTAASAAP